MRVENVVLSALAKPCSHRMAPMSLLSFGKVLAVCGVLLCQLGVFTGSASGQIEKVQCGEKTYAFWTSVGVGIEWPETEPEIIQRDLEDGTSRLSYRTTGGASLTITAQQRHILSDDLAVERGIGIAGLSIRSFVEHVFEIEQEIRTLAKDGGAPTGVDILETEGGNVCESAFRLASTAAQHSCVIVHLRRTRSGVVAFRYIVQGDEEDVARARDHLRTVRFIGAAGGRLVAERLWLDLEYYRYLYGRSGPYPFPETIHEEAASILDHLSKGSLNWDLLTDSTKAWMQKRFAKQEESVRENALKQYRWRWDKDHFTDVEKEMWQEIVVKNATDRRNRLLEKSGGPLLDLKTSLHDRVVGGGGEIVSYAATGNSEFDLVIRFPPEGAIFRITPDGVFDERGVVLLDADRKTRKRIPLDKLISS